MNTWCGTIRALVDALTRRSAISLGVIRLLEAVTRVRPYEIAVALGSGELGQLVRSLDPKSLQLGIEFATELRTQFEEAAAIDLVADRVGDSLKHHLN